MSHGEGDLLLRITEKDFSEPMQYAGLKDKNGKEICEGDIIEFDCINKDGKEVTERSIIVWDGYTYITVTRCDTSEPLYLVGEDIVEAIGNIYENPELLEQ